ncbi:hypothetical protein SAMN05216184_110112 [Georgenia satyanarayanai]|uniref:Uncharacterized protein n=1 Tax=Georgenia satyanarayanai TaxID=860221 RepID=A0A2Y9AJY8_9MICO|nr:hypothetical protein [Georgenia satyanarayanai]PYF98973.1 hypothetical protein A8987_110112 [Georgenia satyanarayanai]SSA44821.1 hypothetical protein SAMN05216184_110112 [Georgenia satyanarayanai]
MTILVLDTNALRRGHFSAKTLQRWIDAVGEDARIVVPEVVIWEWAEHAATAYATLQSQLQEFIVDPGLYEHPDLADQLPTASLTERITAMIPESVEVWSPPNSFWRQSVMDQVLQVGAGERKQGVKTGAADSVVLACVEHMVASRRNAEAVVLATNDSRLRFNCGQRFGDEVLTAKGTADLLEQLNAFVPAEQELFEGTEDALRAAVEDESTGIGAALATFDMGFQIHTTESASGEGRAPVRDLARLGPIEIVELHGLRVTGAEAAERVGLADVRVFADIHMTRLELRGPSAGSAEWVTTFDDFVPHGFVDLTVAVAWDRFWKVLSVSPTGPAVIVFDSAEYDELDDVPPFHTGESLRVARGSDVRDRRG